MDGVLVKSNEVWFRVVEAAGVRFRGRAITRAEFEPTFGQGTAADIPCFELACTVKELDAFYADEFVRHLDAVWVNPDAAPVLKGLAAKGVKRALVTNTVGPLARAILQRAGVETLFDFLGTADLVPRAKPEPDVVLLACRSIGVEPSESVMVGDTRFDRQAAHAAGARFAGYGGIVGDVTLASLTELLSLA
ncbi:MAG: HAD family hydrolase [Archangium sp.]|nr:HAD family hydrolase [Archangium sp.]